MKTNQKQQLSSKENSEYYRILLKQHGKKYADQQWASRDPEIVIESLSDLVEEDEDDGPLY